MTISVTQNAVTVEVSLVAPPLTGHVHTWGQVEEWSGFPGSSTGGNGSADAGKLAQFGSTGSLTISTGLLVNSTIFGNTFVGAFTPRYIAGAQTAGANAGATWTISAPEFSSPSDSFVYNLPSKSGTFAMTSDIPSDVVRYSPQVLTATQKNQARQNIGADLIWRNYPLMSVDNEIFSITFADVFPEPGYYPVADHTYPAWSKGNLFLYVSGTRWVVYDPTVGESGIYLGCAEGSADSLPEYGVTTFTTTHVWDVETGGWVLPSPIPGPLPHMRDFRGPVQVAAASDIPSDVVRTSPQTLAGEEKEVARENINSASLTVKSIAPTRLLWFGDSIIGYSIEATFPRDEYARLTHQAKAACYGNWDYIPNGNDAVWSFGGHSAAQLLSENHLAAAIAAMTGAGDCCVPFAGANDLAQNYTAAQTAANIIALWDALEAAGKMYIPCEMIRRGDSIYYWEIEEVNRLLRDEANRRGIEIVKWSSSVGGFADGSFATTDGVHPSVVGIIRMGGIAASALAKFFPSRTARAFLSANAALAGATLGNSWTPTGITLSGTATPSAQGYTTATDGGNNWYTVTLTNGGGTILNYQLATTALADLSGITARAKSSVEIQVDTISGAGLHNNQLGFRAVRTDAASTWVYAGKLASADDTIITAAAQAQTWRTGRVETIPLAKDTDAAWTSITAYNLIRLHPNSVIRVRVRNLGVVACD